MFVFVFNLIFSAVTAQAAPAACEFAQTIHGTFAFPQVELISRDPRIGLWRGGDIVLKPWIEISEHAYLGVDQQGRVLNVITMPDRRVGFILSGERKIKDIFLLKPGTLLAIDDAGELLEYRFDKTETRFARKIIGRAGKRYLRDLCLAGASLAGYAATGGIGWGSAEMLIGAGLAITGSGFIEGFRGAVEFETVNESARDGFNPLGVRVKDFRYAEYVWQNGVMSDFELTRKDGATVSLLDLIESKLSEDAAVNFDKTCEHELIPRGIPPEDYTPKWSK